MARRVRLLAALKDERLPLNTGPRVIKSFPRGLRRSRPWCGPIYRQKTEREWVCCHGWLVAGKTSHQRQFKSTHLVQHRRLLRNEPGMGPQEDEAQGRGDQTTGGLDSVGPIVGSLASLFGRERTRSGLSADSLSRIETPLHSGPKTTGEACAVLAIWGIFTRYIVGHFSTLTPGH